MEPNCSLETFPKVFIPAFPFGNINTINNINLLTCCVREWHISLECFIYCPHSSINAIWESPRLWLISFWVPHKALIWLFVECIHSYNTWKIINHLTTDLSLIVLFLMKPGCSDVITVHDGNFEIMSCKGNWFHSWCHKGFWKYLLAFPVFFNLGSTFIRPITLLYFSYND